MISTTDRIATERLELVAFSKLSKTQRMSFGEDQSITPKLSKDHRIALKQQLTRLNQCRQDALFGGLWLILKKSDRMVVGSLAAFEVTDRRYTVLFDYHLEPGNHGYRYINEVIKEVYLFALTQMNILSVILDSKDISITEIARY
ncbi:MAG: hypothetical protein FWG21_04655 [Oscillospiraceae bacterium]|nr:hypothetical protein [Oscillospiraceae bacterium]